MKKLGGSSKVKVAVFISGKGSNLKKLIKYSLRENAKFQISLIVSSNLKALGLKYAKQFNIKKKIINYKNKKIMEKDLIIKLQKERINIICLAGFMKIISKNFIKKFKGKIINIHPSLLPKYKGLNTHSRVINNKERYSGCTVHYVNHKIDSGKIILQKKIKILKSDTPRSLASKILKEEHIIYPKALNKVLINL
tara:strand:+ start:144 stop:728 length:585 start_codon:yes stop_codon:yes gene_type:complete